MSFDMPPDPYLALNVPKDADADTIKKSWRLLAKQHHPDKNRDEATKAATTDIFQRVQAAYELLSDPTRRSKYDDQIRIQEFRHSKPAQYSESRPSAGPSPTSYRSARSFENTFFEERTPASRHTTTSYEEEVRSYSRNVEGFDRERKTSGGHTERKGTAWKAAGIPVDFALNMKKRAGHAKEKIKEKDVRAASTKAREQGRRREATHKQSSRRAYVEDEYSSDSDEYMFVRVKKPGRGPADIESPRRSRAEPRTRSSRHTDPEDDWRVDKHQDQHALARDYINKLSADRPQPPIRTDSHSYFEPRGERGHRRSASDRDERRDDRRYDAEERPRTRSRRPSYAAEPEVEARAPPVPPMPAMSSTTSAPANLRNMEDRRNAPRDMPRESGRLHRTSTTEGTSREYRSKEAPSMPRSKTMPSTQASVRRGENAPARSSNLKPTETQDSGYGSSSPTVPETRGPPTPSSRFQIVSEDSEHSHGGPTILVDPEDAHRRTRSPVERPGLSKSRTKSSRVPPSLFRSSTDMPSRPSPSRHESTRSTQAREPTFVTRSPREKPLYREVSSDEYDSSHRHRSSSERNPLSRSKHTDPIYESSSRRGSRDTARDEDDYSRSYYPSDPRISGMGKRVPVC